VSLAPCLFEARILHAADCHRRYAYPVEKLQPTVFYAHVEDLLTFDEERIDAIFLNTIFLFRDLAPRLIRSCSIRG
jgi:hypothetical protein